MCVDGVTYRHECDLGRNQCYCRSSDSRCGKEEFGNHKASEHSSVKYYGECKGNYIFLIKYNIFLIA